MPGLSDITLNSDNFVPYYTTNYYYDPRVHVDTSNLLINGMCVEDYLLTLLRNPLFNKEVRRLLRSNSIEVE